MNAALHKTLWTDDPFNWSVTDTSSRNFRKRNWGCSLTKMVADVKACELVSMWTCDGGCVEQKTRHKCKPENTTLACNSSTNTCSTLDRERFKPCPQKIRKEPEKTPDILHLEQFRTPCTGLEAITPFLSFNTLPQLLWHVMLLFVWLYTRHHSAMFSTLVRWQHLYLAKSLRKRRSCKN